MTTDSFTHLLLKNKSAVFPQFKFFLDAVRYSFQFSVNHLPTAYIVFE